MLSYSNSEALLTTASMRPKARDHGRHQRLAGGFVGQVGGEGHGPGAGRGHRPRWPRGLGRRAAVMHAPPASRARPARARSRGRCAARAGDEHDRAWASGEGGWACFLQCDRDDDSTRGPDSLSARLQARLRAAIAAAGGWLPFDRFMAHGAVRTRPRLLRTRQPAVRRRCPRRAAISSPRRSSRRCSAGRWRARWRRRWTPAQADEVFEFGAGSGALAAHCWGRWATGAALLDRRPVGHAARAAAPSAWRPSATACAGSTPGPRRCDGVVRRQRSARRDAGAAAALGRRAVVRARRGGAAGDAFAWADRTTACGRRPSRAVRARHRDRDPPRRPRPSIRTLADRLQRGAAHLHRLRLPRGRVLPPAAQRRHADVPPRAPRRHRPAGRRGRQGHHRACQFHRHRAGRPGRRAGRRRLHLAGALPAELRPARPAARRRPRAPAAAAQKLLAEHEMGELFKVIGLAARRSLRRRSASAPATAATPL